MRTCEHCGADAVDARGVCAVCGWHASPDMTHEDESSPSLGATRAASVGDYAVSRAGASRSPARDELGRGGAGAMPPPLELRQSAARQSPSGPSRFCGACGARIGGDEVFCGQCGTPVGASGDGYGTLQGRPFEGRGAYDGVNLSETWTPSQHDDRTEAFAPVARGLSGSGVPNVAYRPAGYDRSQPGPIADQGGSSRTTRLVAGVVCLGVSLVSAVLAILLAH